MSDLLKRMKIIWNAVALGGEYGPRYFVDRMAAGRIWVCSHRANVAHVSVAIKKALGARLIKVAGPEHSRLDYVPIWA